MKKLLLLSAFCCCAVYVDAQKTYLTGITEAKESIAYRYNDKNLVDSIGIMSLDEAPHYDLFEYNEFGKVTKTKGYDDLYINGNYRLTSFIDYEYNDKKQMSVRLNYNDFGDGAQLSGRLSYSYDDEGRLSKIVYEYSLGSGMFEKFMEDVYKYDDKGRIDCIESYEESVFTGEIELTVKQVYAYKDNSDAVLSVITYQKFDDEMKETGKREVSYDEAGNVIVDKTYRVNSKGEYNIESSDEYKYDLTVTAENIVMPYDFEAPDLAHENIKNKILSRDFSALDVDTEEFKYVSTYYYNYSSVGTGISTVTESNGKPMIRINYSGNLLLISSELTGENVGIYDISGRAVRGYIVNGNSVDISMLRSGVYVAKIGDKSFKFRK